MNWAAVTTPRSTVSGGAVPQVDIERAPRVFAAMHQAISTGLIESCHDLSEGGLAVAIAEMAFAGDLGVDADLNKLAAASGISCDTRLLFSESNTRFLIEVTPENADRVGELLNACPLTEIGQVTADASVSVVGASGSTVLQSDISDLRSAWKQPLAW